MNRIETVMIASTNMQGMLLAVYYLEAKTLRNISMK